jgi:hypothetical protein
MPRIRLPAHLSLPHLGPILRISLGRNLQLCTFSIGDQINVIKSYLEKLFFKSLPGWKAIPGYFDLIYFLFPSLYR